VPEPAGPAPAAEAPDAERAAVLAFAAHMRRALDAAAGARPPVAAWARAAELSRDLAELMTPYRVVEEERIYGQVREAPGRGQVLVPAIRVLHRDVRSVTAEMVLDATHRGRGYAAHGGVLPLVFDELLGQLANTGGRPPARTAYLHVDYRAVTPVGAPVRLLGCFLQEHGRKRVLRASAHDGEQLLAEAEGLFVELRPGQP
jgi:acyl-coenzyme A thioesterase PaaI-like protein